MLEILGFAAVMVAVFVPILIRFEHRLTRVETKQDVLLEKNGLDPKDYARSKGKATRR